MLSTHAFRQRIPHYLPASRKTFSTIHQLRQLQLAFDLHEPPKPKDGTASKNAPIIFMHGLFGSKKNNRSMSKVLARDLNRPVYAIDLRNHGDSPHDPVHNYTVMADDVEGFLQQHGLSGPTLMGHSMGAKVAMTVALRSPGKVADIVSIDNAPVDAALKGDFGNYVQGLRKVDEAGVTKQTEADKILEAHAPELPVRQFLLTNLVRVEGGKQRLRIPIKYLGAALDDMADFPFKDPDTVRFDKRALFVRGTKSHYIADEMLPIVGRFFPRFELADIDAGHWVVSENPEGFRKAAEEFLQETD